MVVNDSRVKTMRRLDVFSVTSGDSLSQLVLLLAADSSLLAVVAFADLVASTLMLPRLTGVSCELLLELES